MRPRVVPLLVLAVALAGLTGPHDLWAKGPVDKITVDRAGAEPPIEITDEDALAGFDPWGRQFIDWDRGVAAPPRQGSEVQMVSFWLDGRVIYVLEYTPDGGYIYLPGQEHAAYRINAGTIIWATTDRWDPNGKWHYATPGWVQLLASGVGVRPPATGDGGLR